MRQCGARSWFEQHLARRQNHQPDPKQAADHTEREQAQDCSARIAC